MVIVKDIELYSPIENITLPALYSRKGHGCLYSQRASHWSVEGRPRIVDMLPGALQIQENLTRQIAGRNCNRDLRPMGVAGGGLKPSTCGHRLNCAGGKNRELVECQSSVNAWRVRDSGQYFGQGVPQ